MFEFASLSVRLAGILRDAMAVLARLGPTGAAPGPVLVAIANLIQSRIRRFERLVARVMAGKPGVVRTPTSGTVRVGREVRPKRPSLVPRGFAWAVKMHQGTAVFGSQLQALLAEPAMIELLQRAPDAGSILRPLCRMLALDVPEMLLTDLQKTQAAAKADRDSKRVRRAPREPEFPGGEHWPGVKAWRAKWEAFAAGARAPPFGPVAPRVESLECQLVMGPVLRWLRRGGS